MSVNKSEETHMDWVRKATQACFFFLLIVPVAIAVLKQRREADAALFSELHRKLQTQVGVFISLGDDANLVAHWASSVNFPVLPGSSECPEASVVRPLPIAKPRRGPTQTIQQSEKPIFESNCFSPCHVGLFDKQKPVWISFRWLIFFLYQSHRLDQESSV